MRRGSSRAHGHALAKTSKASPRAEPNRVNITFRPDAVQAVLMIPNDEKANFRAAHI